MSAPAKAHEPTMEEILASIRRIISDDDTANPPPAAPRPAPAEAEDAPVEQSADALGQDDIDAMFAAMDAPAPERIRPEAGPELFAPPAPPRAGPPPLPAPDDLDVIELTDPMDEYDAPPPPEPRRPAPEAFRAPEPARAEPQLPAAPDRLMSPGVDDAVTQAFGSLANTVLSNNGRSIDDVVREMLRPMLRAWLDDNLPPLVERLVRQEIERVARGGR